MLGGAIVFVELIYNLVAEGFIFDGCRSRVIALRKELSFQVPVASRWDT